MRAELAGDYDDIRAFLYALETANEFVIVDSILLGEGDDAVGAAQPDVERVHLLPGDRCPLSRAAACILAVLAAVALVAAWQFMSTTAPDRPGAASARRAAPTVTPPPPADVRLEALSPPVAGPGEAERNPFAFGARPAPAGRTRSGTGGAGARAGGRSRPPDRRRRRRSPSSSSAWSKAPRAPASRC